MNLAENKLKEINVLAKQLADLTEEIPKSLSIDNSSFANKSGINFQEKVRNYEVTLIINALIQTGGSQTKAAQLLGIKLTTLNNKIKHFSIPVGKTTEFHLQNYLSNMES